MQPWATALIPPSPVVSHSGLKSYSFVPSSARLHTSPGAFQLWSVLPTQFCWLAQILWIWSFFFDICPSNMDNQAAQLNSFYLFIVDVRSDVRTGCFIFGRMLHALYSSWHHYPLKIWRGLITKQSSRVFNFPIVQYVNRFYSLNISSIKSLLIKRFNWSPEMFLIVLCVTRKNLAW